jgi:hypothetical protein
VSDQTKAVSAQLGSAYSASSPASYPASAAINGIIADQYRAITGSTSTWDRFY